MTTKYDDVRHSPPAPVAWVVIENPSTGAKVSDVPMLIDSGADLTLLPAGIVSKLDLQVSTEKGYELADFDGTTKRISYATSAVVVLGGLRFKGQYLSGDSEIGVIGRNLLNNIVLELDGPRHEWRMRTQ